MYRCTTSKKFEAGFTLIELLVVIAIIGILASVVLGSLNSARSRGNDAAVRANISGIRTQAELFYDTSVAQGGGGLTYTGLCSNATIASQTSAARVASGAASINTTFTTGGSATVVTCHAAAGSWAVESPLRAGGMWCVDNTGAATSTTGSTLGASDTTCGP